MISGFHYIGACNCGGTRQEKWMRGDYIVYYKIKRKTYSIKHKSSYTEIDKPLSTLCEKLKSLGLVDSLECLSTS